jgi:hypothetical protein
MLLPTDPTSTWSELTAASLVNAKMRPANKDIRSRSLRVRGPDE